MNINLPLYIFTESKSIFDTITASKHLKELRLMNDMSEIRCAYRKHEITNIALVKTFYHATNTIDERSVMDFVARDSWV